MTLEPLSPTWFAVWATAVAVVAVDVGKTYIFRRFRRRVNGHNLTLGKLVKCPWCLSHWLSAAVCLGYGIMNPVWWFALTGAAAVPMLVYCGLLWLLEDERLNCDRPSDRNCARREDW